MQYDSAMPTTSHRFQRLAGRDSLHPERDRRLRRSDAVVQVLAIAAIVLQYGLRQAAVQLELGLFVFAAMTWLTVSVGLRYRWSLARTSFLRSHRVPLLISGVWLLTVVGILLFGPLLATSDGGGLTRFEAFVRVSTIAAILRGAVQTILVIRRATAGATDPALVLVTSFLVLIAVGTALLMLPRSVADPAAGDEPDRFLTALFTATSASCVTGLTVKTTGTYWSPFGQTVILGLFQIGGLGIMTCGAFFAVASGRRMLFRESATLRDMLESEQLGDVRRLVLAILVFTLMAEMIGAVAISGLWSDLPPGERLRFSIFHSVSAFCNAGFSLTDNSFVEHGHRWQVWGAVTVQIIIGSTGFAVLYDVITWGRVRILSLRFGDRIRTPGTHAKLSLTTRLAATTTIVLLIAGTVGYYLLESPSTAQKPEQTEPLAEAWFQSVTFRTAGFNTVDHGDLQPATKLFAIFLMFVGASPGSTGVA